MRALSFLIAIPLLMACQEDTDGSTGQTIIETGYLECSAPIEGCAGVASCIDADGASVCVQAPPDQCVESLTCACVGDWLCGEEGCIDRPGGIECGAGELPDQGFGLDARPAVDAAEDAGVEPIIDAAAPLDGGEALCSVESEPCQQDSFCCEGLTCSDAGTCERPFSFGIVINNDIEESIWVQLSTNARFLAWLDVTRDGAPVQLYQDCGPQDCGDAIECDAPMNVIRDITGGGFGGEHRIGWDRSIRVPAAGQECVEAVRAPDGEYVARICLGFQARVDGEGDPTMGVEGVIENPVCRDVPFTLPMADEAVHRIEGG